jgi:hypothetical protein
MSTGLKGSVISVGDAGKSPQDGFTEYQGYPDGTSPSNRLYFSNEYIQTPTAPGSAITLTIGTCGGTPLGRLRLGDLPPRRWSLMPWGSLIAVTVASSVAVAKAGGFLNGGHLRGVWRPRHGSTRAPTCIA